MKALKIILLSSLCVFTLALWGQVNTGEYTEILLKTGYTVRGKVVEFTPGESLTLQTIDGSTITYPTSEIEAYGKGAKPKAGGNRSSGSQFNPENFRLFAHFGFGTSGATKSDSDTKSIFRFPSLIGIGAMLKIDDMFSLHADVNYELKGYKISTVVRQNSNKYEEISYKQKLNYLTIPVYACVSVPYENFIFYGQLGPYAGLLLREQKDDVTTFMWNNHRAFDFGFLIGAGIVIPFNDHIGFRAGLRYTRGVKKITEEAYNYNYPDIDAKIKNRSFAINGSLVYRL